MISDTVLDKTPGANPQADGSRSWTRTLTPKDDELTAQVLTQMGFFMPMFGGSIADFATDRIAMLGGHETQGAGHLGPFVCVQKLSGGPSSEVKLYDASMNNAGMISAVDACSPYTWGSGGSTD